MTTLSELNAAWEVYRLAKIMADRPGTLEDGLAARRAWNRFAKLSDEYTADLPPLPEMDRSNVAIFPVHRTRFRGR